MEVFAIRTTLLRCWKCNTKTACLYTQTCCNQPLQLCTSCWQFG